MDSSVDGEWPILIVKSRGLAQAPGLWGSAIPGRCTWRIDAPVAVASSSDSRAIPGNPSKPESKLKIRLMPCSSMTARWTASVARTWGLGPRLFVVDWGRTADLQNRCALPPAGFCSSCRIHNSPFSISSSQISGISCQSSLVSLEALPARAITSRGEGKRIDTFHHILVSTEAAQFAILHPGRIP